MFNMKPLRASSPVKESSMDIFQLFISAIFVNNIVLAQYLGNCPYLGCSKEQGVAFGMGSAVVFVTIMATLFTWLIQTFEIGRAHV